MENEELTARTELGDAIVEGSNGEFLQWHREGNLYSVWWSANGKPIENILPAIEKLGDIDDEKAVGTIKLIDDSAPHELPARDVLELARDDISKVDFFVIDVENVSIAWMSPLSDGREKTESPFGEVSVVVEINNDKKLLESLKATATPAIGKSALRLVRSVSNFGW